MNEQELDIRAKKASAAIATLRKRDNQFFASDVANDLKELGCPYFNRMPHILLNLGVATRNKGYFKFVTSEPIHHNLLRPELDKVASIKKEYNDLATITKHNMKRFPASWKEADPELLIEYLKAQGYKVLREKTDWIEC